MSVKATICAGQPLSPRETECLKLIAEGKTNKAIAGSMGITYHTVVEHVSAVLFKLDVSTRAEAARVAAGKGLV